MKTATVTALPTSAASSARVTISAPKIKAAKFKLIGSAPYMQARFAEKSINKMREAHEAGSTARNKKTREARNFEADCEAAKHISTEGWIGIPAGAFRTACIDVCRLVGFKMTLAKLSIFIEPDGFDKVDGTPLVKISGTPETNISGVRNATGVMDLRARPMWRDWSVDLTVKYDEDQFTLADVTNLLMRVGMQCGVGEGRPNSRMSTGVGFGTFTVK